MCPPALNRSYSLGLGAAALFDTPYLKVKLELEPVLSRWGNGYLLRIEPSGSYAKGTAVKGGADVDIFCSVSSSVPNSLPQIYSTLANALSQAGYAVRRQNVSLGIQVNGYKVDITPGRRRDPYGNDHSLYSSKKNSWIQTDINKQIAFVRDSGRVNEIRWLKAWRNRHDLDWPSFHLELFTINVLKGCRTDTFWSNIILVLMQIESGMLSNRLIDPANSNNNASDDLSGFSRGMIQHAASKELAPLRA